MSSTSNDLIKMNKNKSTLSSSKSTPDKNTTRTALQQEQDKNNDNQMTPQCESPTARITFEHSTQQIEIYASSSNNNNSIDSMNETSVTTSSSFKNEPPVNELATTENNNVRNTMNKPRSDYISYTQENSQTVKTPSNEISSNEISPNSSANTKNDSYKEPSNDERSGNYHRKLVHTRKLKNGGPQQKRLSLQDYGINNMDDYYHDKNTDAEIADSSGIHSTNTGILNHPFTSNNNEHLNHRGIITNNEHLNHPGIMSNNEHQRNDPTSYATTRRVGRPKGSKNKNKNIGNSVTAPPQYTCNPPLPPYVAPPQHPHLHPSQHYYNDDMTEAYPPFNSTVRNHHTSFENTKFTRKRNHLHMAPHPNSHMSDHSVVGNAPGSNSRNPDHPHLYNQGRYPMTEMPNRNTPISPLRMSPAVTSGPPTQSNIVVPTNQRYENPTEAYNYTSSVVQRQQQQQQQLYQGSYQPHSLQRNQQHKHEHNIMQGTHNYHNQNAEFLTEAIVQPQSSYDNEYPVVGLLPKLPASDLFKQAIDEKINAIAQNIRPENETDANPVCYLYCNDKDECIERDTLLTKNVVFTTDHGFLSIVHQQIYVIKDNECSQSLCTFVIHEHSLPISLMNTEEDHLYELFRTL